MRYALEDLLRIRRIREDRAERMVEQKRKGVTTAESLLSQCIQKLEEFRSWRTQEEARLFHAILNRQVFVRDIDELRLRLALLRSEEALHEQSVEEARIKLREAQRMLENAIMAYRKAVQARQKIDEHRRLWLVEAKREEELAEGVELEDFVSEPRDESGGWEEHDESAVVRKRSGIFKARTVASHRQASGT